MNKSAHFNKIESLRHVALREQILSANVNMHRAEASVYDTRHGELFNHYAQARFKDALKKEVARLQGLMEPGEEQEIHALDCACGTGNISEKLLRIGCKVVGVDISVEMLRIMNSKLKATYEGRYELFHQDVDSFLEFIPAESFHIIVFCSALHHLPHYGETFRNAVRAVKRPGIICVFHEPLPPAKRYVSAFSRTLFKIDRCVWKYSTKVLRRKAPSETISPNDANLADYHSSRDGVDPSILLEIIQGRGGSIAMFSLSSQKMRHFWSAALDNSFKLRKDGFYLTALFAK